MSTPNEIIQQINILAGSMLPTSSIVYTTGSVPEGSTVYVVSQAAVSGTISTEGIFPGAIIKSEQVLGIINALNGINPNLIILSGSLQVTGSLNSSGSIIANRGVTGSLFGTASWAQNTTSASYVLNVVSASFATSASQTSTASYVNPLNQQVIITGSLNVTGSINVVSGSAFTRWGNKLFNYGAFSSTQTQSGSRNTTLSASFNTTDIGGSGVSIVDNTKITVDNTGIYNLQFSAQLDRLTSGTNIVTIWFAYTGSSIANSATDVTITGAAAANPTVASWNYVLPMSASSYVEMYWSHNDDQDNQIQIKAVGTRTGPIRPAVPSIIATLTQIA